jgi:pimeloyl-ACP methyl ester carboxylesterase
VPTVRQQVQGAVQNALLRPGADATYADGDDSAWTGIDWMAMTRRLRILGREVNVVDTGGEDKPVMLFIHGLGGRWQNWLLNIPQFMDTHRVIAPDLPGFGESEMPAEDISISGYANVVDALCEALGVECPIVIGNSMGGFVGADLAINHPTRVERLVLVSAAGLSIEYLRRRPVLTGARLFAINAAWLGPHGESVIRRPRLRRATLQFLVRYPEKLSPQLTYELVEGTGKPGFLPALEALMSYSFRDHLAKIEVPVLIVWGRNDMLVPVRDAHEYAELIGDNARAVIFEDTGHLPMLERPSRFHDMVGEFIEGDPTPESEIEGVSA